MKNIKKLLLPLLLVCAVFGFCMFGCSKLVRTNFSESKKIEEPNFDIHGDEPEDANLDENGDDAEQNSPNDAGEDNEGNGQQNQNGNQSENGGGQQQQNEGQSGEQIDNEGSQGQNGEGGENESGEQIGQQDENLNENEGGAGAPEISYSLVCVENEVEHYYEDAADVLANTMSTNVQIKLLKNVSVLGFTISASIEIDLNGFALETTGGICLQNGVLCIFDGGDSVGRLYANQIEINEGDLAIFGGAIDCEIALNEGTLSVGGGLFYGDNLEIVGDNLASGCDIASEPVELYGKTYYEVVKVS